MPLGLLIVLCIIGLILLVVLLNWGWHLTQATVWLLIAKSEYYKARTKQINYHIDKERERDE